MNYKEVKENLNAIMIIIMGLGSVIFLAYCLLVGFDFVFEEYNTAKKECLNGNQKMCKYLDIYFIK